MGVDELICTIYDFEGTPDKWLDFEKKVYAIIEKYTDEENEKLIESDAMETMSMVCEGIRFEREK